MNRTVVAIALSAFMLMGLLPRRTEAGALEGALIGGAIGAVVGLIIEASKPKPVDSVPKPRTPSADTLSVARPDSVPVFR